MTLPHKNVQEYSKGKHAGVWNVQKCNYNTPPLQPNQRWLSNPTMSLSCFPYCIVNVVHPRTRFNILGL